MHLIARELLLAAQGIPRVASVTKAVIGDIASRPKTYTRLTGEVVVVGTGLETDSVGHLFVL